MPDAPDKNGAKDPQLETIRDEEFTSLYSNNVQFEPTLWDLKLIFGQVDIAKTQIGQHTAMALSWPMAKLVAYFMVINTIFQQENAGPILIPPHLIPKRPDPFEPSLNEQGKKVAAYLAWVHDQFFSDHPYSPPDVTEVSAPSPKADG